MKKKIAYFLAFLMLIGGAEFSYRNVFAQTYPMPNRVQRVVALIDVALKRAPLTNSKTKLTIKRGRVMLTYGYKFVKNKKWRYVKYKGYKGYVRSKYTELIKGNTNISSYRDYIPNRRGMVIKRVNMRVWPASKYRKITSLTKETKLAVLGYRYNGVKKWFLVESKGMKGYVLGSNISVNTPKMTAKEIYMYKLKKKGFPSSYAWRLWNIHKNKTNWIFEPIKIDFTWNELVEKAASRSGTNLIRQNNIKAWLSYEKGAYNFQKNRHKIFDGNWYPADKRLQKYYLDPRNFLNEEGIFQFMQHQFNSAYQTVKTIRAGFGPSFLARSKKINYGRIIYRAARSSGVNANVIVAMLRMEQGNRGKSPLISGKVKGYEGLYNYFNIGAFNSKKMNKIKRGLWYARGGKNNSRKYGRPWTNREKSIAGGAMFYKSQYIDNRQYTYYTKKFNVGNGLRNVGRHEYMTNVQGAEGEGVLLSKVFKDKNLKLKFYIPVYKNMPYKAAVLPSKKGSNDNLLNYLYVKNYSLNKRFDRYKYNYSIKVPAAVDKISVMAGAHDKEAKIYNKDIIKIKGKKSVRVIVKSTSGVYRVYVIKIERES